MLTPKDESQLSVLPLFFKIFSVLSGCASSIFILHIVIGAASLLNPKAFESSNGQGGMPVAVSILFIVMGAGVVLAGWAFAVILFKTAGWIQRREKHTWVTAVSALCCFQIPVGAALGVFSLVVITRKQVKALFKD